MKQKVSTSANYGCYYDVYSKQTREHSEAKDLLQKSINRQSELEAMVKHGKLRKVVVYQGKDMRFWFEDIETGKKVK